VDGTPNSANIKNDTQANRILVSRDFAYWGGAGPRIPAKFRNYSGVDLRAGRGHKQKLFSEAFITDFVAWFRSLNVKGYAGMPIDWDKTP
jgi:Nucleotide modification associated domain 2